MSHPVRPVRVRAVIPASPEKVIAYVADTRNDPEWCPNVESAELVSGDGHSPGSVFRYRQYLDSPGSKRRHFDGEVTVVARAPDSITWDVNDKFQSRRITLSVEPHPSGCRITQVTRAAFHQPPGIARWAYPLLARRILKAQFAALAGHFSSASA
jgi:uncharacterized protein (DUF58 family)